jgi:DNA-directed RNA polymerase specialized sigma24 family protein
MIGAGQSEFLLKNLTRRQRQVIDCIIEGYSRRETAAKLGISLQAVHQIIPRMRQRLQKKVGIAMQV